MRLRHLTLPGSPSAARNPAANGAENRGQVVHARIAPGRKHAVQALARNVRQLREQLESHRCIDEIAQNHPCSLGLSADKQRGSLIKEFLGECRVTLNSSDDCLLSPDD